MLKYGMRSVVRCAVVVASGGFAVGAASAGAFETYGSSYREVTAPPIGAGSFGVAGDALADGRLISVTGRDIFVETAVGSGVFAKAGEFAEAVVGPAVDPSFVRVSPDGSRIALGAGFGKPIVVLETAALNTATPTVFDATTAKVYDLGHNSAAWRNDSELAFSDTADSVWLLDTTSSTTTPTVRKIVSGIGGATAGVAFDNEGRLFTGNGFDFVPGGSDTGWIKAFDSSLWETGSVDFETGGLFVADVLSAGPLGFDTEGNLFVGGGDFFGTSGDFGYFGVIDAGALDDAIDGMGAVDTADALELLQLDPTGTSDSYYGGFFNELTGELYITDGVSWFATIPAPGGVAGLTIAALMVARRRRRVA